MLQRDIESYRLHIVFVFAHTSHSHIADYPEDHIIERLVVATRTCTCTRQVVALVHGGLGHIDLRIAQTVRVTGDEPRNPSAKREGNTMEARAAALEKIVLECSLPCLHLLRDPCSSPLKHWHALYVRVALATVQRHAHRVSHGHDGCRREGFQTLPALRRTRCSRLFAGATASTRQVGCNRRGRASAHARTWGRRRRNCGTHRIGQSWRC